MNPSNPWIAFCERKPELNVPMLLYRNKVVDSFVVVQNVQTANQIADQYGFTHWMPIPYPVQPRIDPFDEYWRNTPTRHLASEGIVREAFEAGRKVGK